jgi:hypothetical protein
MIKPTRRTTHTTTDPHSLPARQVVNSYRRSPQEFVVSLATVRSQIHSILSKLGVNSQPETVALFEEYRNSLQLRYWS